jgi:hypothetical protein
VSGSLSCRPGRVCNFFAATQDEVGGGAHRPQRSALDNQAAHDLAFSRHDLPELCTFLSPSFSTKGAGKAGRRLAPAAPCATGLRTRCTGERPQGSQDIPAFPARWFDGLCGALPGEPSSIATVTSRIAGAATPGWAGRTTTRFGASIGRRDHTVLPYANCAVRAAPRMIAHGPRLKSGEHRPAIAVAPTPSAPTASRPAFRDDRDTPLFAGRDDPFIREIRILVKRNIFTWRY